MNNISHFLYPNLVEHGRDLLSRTKLITDLRGELNDELKLLAWDRAVDVFLKEARPILFASRPDILNSALPAPNYGELALPFGVVYCEMSPDFNSDLVEIHDKDKNVKLGMTAFICAEGTAKSPNEDKADFLFIFFLGRDTEHSSERVIHISNSSWRSPFHAAAVAYLNALNEGLYDAGEIPVNLKLKRKTRTGTEVQRLRRIIVLDRKGARKSASTCFGYNINWKHSWEVMGHWRRVPGIGKNRNGEYVVPNKTWVSPCVKGEGDVVRKLRVVRNDSAPRL